MTCARITTTLVVAAWLAGCVSANVEPQVQAIDATAIGLGTEPYEAVQPDWWLAFGDPQLDRVEQEALGNNPGLAGALARVRAAEAQARSLDASDEPQLSLDAEAIRDRLSENYIFPPPFGGGTYWDADLGASLAWNLDFWGRQDALVAQLRSTALASRLDAVAARLALSGAVAQSYVELDRAAALESIAARATEQRRRLVDLTQARVDAGLDTDVELRTAESNLAQVGVEAEQVQLVRESAIHALAALSGRGTDRYADVATPALDLEHVLRMPEALPVDLLARRPDVAAARARVEASRQSRLAAHAAFYPNVSLMAFAGFRSIALDDLLTSGSRTWQVGPAIHLPLFDAGRLRADYERSTAELDASVAAYNDTVLRAVREAADQVSRARSLDRQLARQRLALTAAERAFAVAEKRYGAGLNSYLSVLSAESQVLAARRQRANLLADRAQAHIALMVALGGGFDSSQPAATAATAPAR
jgi:NodT family efflux transporter outer membrane factor (OMF) lipoprotein